MNGPNQIIGVMGCARPSTLSIHGDTNTGIDFPAARATCDLGCPSGGQACAVSMHTRVYFGPRMELSKGSPRVVADSSVVKGTMARPRSLGYDHEVRVVRFADASRLIAVAHDADADQVGDGRIRIAVLEMISKLDVGHDVDASPFARRRGRFDDDRVLRDERIAFAVANCALGAHGAPHV